MRAKLQTEILPLTKPDHSVHFYEDDALLVQGVVHFLGSALVGGDYALCVATEPHRNAIESLLADRGVDLHAVKSRGSLVVLDAAQTLAEIIPGDQIDADVFHAVMGKIVAPMTAEGSSLKVFGEMVSLLVADGKPDVALQLEKLWNGLLANSGVSLLCGYHLNQFAEHDMAGHLAGISQEHSHVIGANAYARSIETVASLESEVSERRSIEKELSERTRTLQVLQNVAATLVAEQELEMVVQVVTDAGCQLTGAQFGAFFYNLENAQGESYTLYTLSGAPPEAFATFPMPRNTEIFARTFRGDGPVRIFDVTKDPRFGKNSPYNGMPKGHLPVCSYLAVPVISKTGLVHGGLFFGHADPGVFTSDSEEFVVTLAAQAAVAIDNSNLANALQRELVALREAEERSRRLAAIVETSDDAIISKTLDGTIVSWNRGAQSLFGYTADEILGKSVTILFPEGHYDEESEIIGRIKKGQKIDHYETIRRHRDGSLIDISLTVSPVLNDEGIIVGASKIARDISQRRRDEAALRHATEELQQSRDELELRVKERTASLREAVGQMEEFSYTVSHDLRAPLRAMNVHCGVLKEDFRSLLETEPDAIYSVNRIAENCIRLDKMIRDVLTYGRVARDELSLENVSLDKLVQEIIYHYPSLQEPNADVQFKELGSVFGHEPSLVQVISNLLTNAVKFTAPGVHPKVLLRTDLLDGALKLWIEDNGIGIDPKYHHRLFSMFERIHPELPYEGTGVGLAIVRKAAERMGGRVGLESDGRTGARFWVELPEARHQR